MVHYGKVNMAFSWKDKYLTGLREIDRQHKKLLTLIDDLEKILKEDSLDLRELKRVVVLLGARVRAHLSYEKELVTTHGHQPNEKTSSINKNFFDAYEILRSKIEEGEIDKYLLEILCLSFKSWVFDHMNLTNGVIRRLVEQENSELLTPDSRT